MIWNSLLSLILLASPQFDMFKKEMPVLQQLVEDAVSPIVMRVMQRPQATYLDGYGVVVTLEVVLTPPATPFNSPVKPGEIQALSTQRQRDVKQKLTAFITQNITALDSLESSQSLAVVVHFLNTNPADVTNLPSQVVLSAKKDAPQQVISREF